MHGTENSHRTITRRFDRLNLHFLQGEQLSVDSPQKHRYFWIKFCCQDDRQATKLLPKIVAKVTKSHILTQN